MPAKKLWLKILVFFIIWRSLLFIVSAQAPKFLEFQPSFPYSESLVAYNLPKFLYSWTNFDGVHYLEIARFGYLKTDLIQAFFPIYPFLMRTVNYAINNLIISGLLISNLFLLGAMFFGFKLCEKWFDLKSAHHFLLVLLTFPTSFYLGAVYTESLFLFLLLAGVWYYESNKNLISGVLIGLSSGTRLVGLMMLPAFFLEWVKKASKKEQSVKTFCQNILKQLQHNSFFILGLIIGSLAFISYIYFLYKQFNDPLYFFNVQSQFGAGRETKMILLPQVFYRSFRILLTARPFNLKYFTYVQDVVLSLLIGFGILFSAKKIKVKYVIFSALAYLIPTLTGNLSSMPRYVLVLFPVLMWWANVIANKKKLQTVYYLIASLLLILNVILFVQGYWVA